MFYRPKHMKSNKFHFQLRKSELLLISLALLFMFSVGGTIAYLIDSTNEVLNTFEPSEVTGEIVEEKFDETTKQNVTINNTGDVAVYVRAKVIINWVDGAGNIVSDVPDGYRYTNPFTYDNETTETPGKWLYHSDTDTYYWTLPVPVNDATGNLINEITVNYPENPEFFLNVDIISEVIQATPTNAVTSAWKNVSVDTSGVLSLNQSEVT